MSTRNRLPFLEKIDCQKSYIAGVLNITPDSFSDGGVLSSPFEEVSSYFSMSEAGADLIDVGGMASGPGSTLLPVEVEKARVMSFCDALLENDLSKAKPMSIDTFRVDIVRMVHEALGLSVVNDISALRFDPEMAAYIADQDLSIVLMYSKEKGAHPLVTDLQPPSGDLIERIKVFFGERIEYALKSNIKEDKIILDPGMGAFLGSDPSLSWELLRRFNEIRIEFSGFPFLLGVSRKSFIGGILEERDLPSKLIELIMQSRGASVIRTHDVILLNRLKRVWDLICGNPC
jgi:dihydropteroate synthase